MNLYKDICTRGPVRHRTMILMEVLYTTALHTHTHTHTPTHTHTHRDIHTHSDACIHTYIIHHKAVG
jgi:hypothetical protein